ncbi:Putative Mn2+ efflux pump MntP [Paenibacillus sp. UNCCL117]|uniref:manganese efflux pump MntP n=1 Tax=unclassified Paenibacillus TaxID=185978 RepID=UPI00088588C9|nr:MULTISPECIES: manganese efflux pump [unclassified Paenibacillus]SDE33392.1 Putative Mn2+ efflux pump MntP [Paenibacillus sp. cl123]SFW64018.1 Putative Mn2+ efflux pump MntP [Paenibacillus sp. UNCCL117]
MDMAAPVLWGQIISIGLLAMALGLDALSLGLGIGMRGIRKLDIMKISLTIALFHVLMPLAGIWMGGYLSMLLGKIATVCGGILLLLLGGHMVYNTLRKTESGGYDHRSFWGMLLFAFSVSVDSFSVGVSLGMFAGDIWLTVLMFGVAGGLMSVLGLLLGRHVGNWVGEYGEALGGVILGAFGIHFLL